MKRYALVLGLFAALVLSGCADKREEIPIADNPSSLPDDEEAKDELQEELPGENIPVYKVKLDDSLSSFQLAIWGESYTLPMTYEEFAARGWVYGGDETGQIGAESYLKAEKFEQKGHVLYADLLNPETDSRPVFQCYVGGLHMDAARDEGQGIFVNLPGGIVYQKSIEEDVAAAYGSPVDRYEEGKSILLTYEYGMNRVVKLGFGEEDGVLLQIDLQNFRNPGGGESLKNVSDEMPPAAKAYLPPEYDGLTFDAFIVRYDGELYRPPAPVFSFVGHGWTVNKEGSDEAVGGGKYGYVTLEKDGRKLYAVVQNYGTEATTIQNCFVTTLYGDLDSTKVMISVAGGITLGMKEETFLSLLGEQQYEKEEDGDKGYDIYTFYGNDSQQDYTQVTVDRMLRMIRRIKVVHSQDMAADNSAAE